MKRETLKIEAHIVKRDFYKGQLESAVYPRVTIEFTNADTTAVEITSCRVKWTTGHKDVKKAQSKT